MVWQVVFVGSATIFESVEEDTVFEGLEQEVCLPIIVKQQSPSTSVTGFVVLQ